jgi:hypothetical protein
MKIRVMSIGGRALAVACAIYASAAMAHQDPPACTGASIGQDLLINPSGRAIRECEPFTAETTLTWLGQCLIGDGNLVIGLADPSDIFDPTADEIITSVPVGCLGDATVTAEGCAPGQDNSVSIAPVQIFPRAVDIAAGFVTVRARWAGVLHQSAGNQPQTNTREVVVPIEPCPDATFCTDVQCVFDEIEGASCPSTDISATVCPDNLFCSNVVCNDDIDQCVTTGIGATQCPDNQFCADVVCNETTDMCDSTPTGPTQCPDNLFCSDVVCNESIDQCVTTGIGSTQCPDNLFCADVVCNETTDMCDSTDTSDKCHLDPEIPDVCEPCNETTDMCEVDLTLDPTCTPDELICRTPGFWKTHAGEEKNRSQNITQAVLDSVGGLTVCGETIDNTLVDSPNSVLEAMCIAPRGDSTLQLIRQLTAMGLNCAVSEIDGDCSGNMALGDLWDDCNAACVGDPSDLTINECIGLIDCFNNGGVIVGETCLTDEFDNCHERELPEEFNPPGPAGSTDACKDAFESECLIGDC